MLWQDEETLQDVNLRDENRPNTGFLSWSNYIKKHKDDPVKRYEIAQQFLPWPIGFKESVLALRSIIREKKKAAEDYEHELSSLYQLAAWESFCPKHCKRIDEPGFKVFEQIPGGYVSALPFTYKELGYEQLKLVTKTDAKKLVELYGEPDQHTTLNDLFADLWEQAEADYLAKLQLAEIKAKQDDTDPVETNAPVAASSEETNINNSVSSEAGSSSSLRSSLSTASKKYDAQGQEIKHSFSQNAISSKTTSPKSKLTKLAKPKSAHGSNQKGQDKRIKAFEKIAKTKQLSGLLVQAVKDRALIKDRIFTKSLQNIKHTLANKKILAALGAGCFIFTKKARSE